MNTQSSHKIIKNKLDLLSLAETFGSVSKACKTMDFNRDSVKCSVKMHHDCGAACVADGVALITRLIKSINVKSRLEKFLKAACLEKFLKVSAIKEFDCMVKSQIVLLYAIMCGRSIRP